MAIPSTMLTYLARKYDIAQQEAGAQTTRVNADANFTNVRAGLLPSEVASENMLRTATANKTNVDASLAPGESMRRNRILDLSGRWNNTLPEQVGMAGLAAQAGGPLEAATDSAPGMLARGMRGGARSLPELPGLGTFAMSPLMFGLGRVLGN